MKSYYEAPGVQIFHGDCREVLPSLGLVETCITDPPYGLGFMGKGWDHAVPGMEFWTVVSRVLLPGGYLLAFGGTRLWHRLAVAVEDSGFEIRDTLMWLYGSGFPKSHDVSKAIDKAACAEREVVGRKKWTPGPSLDRAGHSRQGYRPAGEPYPSETVGKTYTTPATDAAKTWDGYGTALKPAWEPILMARKPLEGTVAGNVQAHGTGTLNIDGCRIEGAPDPSSWTAQRTAIDDSAGRLGQKAANIRAMNDGLIPPPSGRWPANLALDEEAARLLDEQSGEKGGGFGVRGASSHIYGGGKGLTPATGEVVGFGDSGGASRFFYTAKASRSERNSGDAENHHPTVKPLDLMRWLARLTKSPHGGTVLDPFMGSGSTLVAAREEFRPVIGIELDERYCEISARRLSQGVLDFGGAA